MAAYVYNILHCLRIPPTFVIPLSKWVSSLKGWEPKGFRIQWFKIKKQQV